MTLLVPVFRLYSEVLRNIRSATIIAVMQEDTVIDRAVIIGKGTTAEVTINGGQVHVELPAPLESLPRAIPPQSTPVSEFTMRFALENRGPTPDGHPASQLGAASVATELENIVPWDASHLDELGRTLVRGFIACRKCETPFVSIKDMRGWKDLPREGWEESLDLWHCHRPHEQGSGDARHPAMSRVEIVRGHGHVGMGYFLVAEGDCTNLQVCYSIFALHTPICPGCKEGGFCRSLAPDLGNAFDTSTQYQRESHYDGVSLANTFYGFVVLGSLGSLCPK
jgi:hypothetical protein